MFYDLEDPVEFCKQIKKCLDVDGIWHLEQSYLPSMLRTNSYDTVCHEHLEYYSLHSLEYILNKAQLKVINIRVNAVNGGSFSLDVTHQDTNKYFPDNVTLNWIRKQEVQLNLDSPKVYRDFEDRVFSHRQNLRDLLTDLRASGKTILGYGASTKGNVTLQFCGITDDIVSAIIEVNPAKFGCYTPGTNIPIISESEAVSFNPDYYLLLPWHFKDGILNREKEFRSKGGKFIIPMPEIEIV